MSERLPDALIDALRAVSLWAQVSDVPMVVVGGVAASLLGRPRMTRDIDALVSIPQVKWQAALLSAANFALQPRVEDPIEFAVKTRVLLLRHEPSLIDVDVMFGALAFEEAAISNAATRCIADFEIRLPRVEDLIVMKAIAHRPRDMGDIEGLLAANKQINLTEVRRWVSEFALATTMPDLLNDFDMLVKKSRDA